MIANVAPDPFPFFEYTSPAETVVWAACATLAVVFAGWSLLLGANRSRRRIALRLVAVVLACIACGISFRSQGRWMDERIEETRRDRERLAAPNPPAPPAG
jgi:predicted signal transduction protein with EAL and GGDEF domain